MSRFITIKAVSGVRNDVLSERFDKTDLVDGVNIDLSETGQISRRKGMRRVVSGTDVHSFGVAADRAFYVDGNTLYELTADLTTIALRSSLATGRRMNYLDIGGRVIASNGIDGLVTDGSHVFALGLAPPPPLVPTVVSGTLPAGDYGVTMTFLRTDGAESGAPGSSYVAVPKDGGLEFSALPVSADPSVTSKRLYITEPNGEVPFLAMTLPNSLSFATYTDPTSLSFLCSTQFKSALPAGDVLALYNGRTYSAVGNVLWYSDPYNYELCDMRTNYLQFDSKVMIVAPVRDGIFVGTETETVFLAGDDPSVFQSVVVSPAGSARGTLSYADPRFVTAAGMKGKTPMWVTTHGIAAGGDSGVFVELTSDRYVLPEVSSGASMYQYKSGNAQFLSVLY